MKITIEINEPLMETLVDTKKNSIAELVQSALFGGLRLMAMIHYKKEFGVGPYQINRPDWLDIKGRLEDAIQITN